MPNRKLPAEAWLWFEQTAYAENKIAVYGIFACVDLKIVAQCLTALKWKGRPGIKQVGIGTYGVRINGSGAFVFVSYLSNAAARYKDSYGKNQ